MWQFECGVEAKHCVILGSDGLSQKRKFMPNVCACLVLTGLFLYAIPNTI